MAIDLVGAAAQVAEIKTMTATLRQALGNRLKDVSVVLKTADEMPQRSDGGVSYGFWKSGLRQIWLWDETDGYPVAKTLAHEAMHVLDADWLTRAQRLEIIALMSPMPTAWGDQLIGGARKKYVGLPSEVFAVYASAAVCNLDRPAYRRLFKRTVPPDKWARLAEITLRDAGAAQREPEGPVDVPSPPDLMEDLQAQLASVQAELTAALAAKAKAEAKLQAAKKKATEISAI